MVSAIGSQYTQGATITAALDPNNSDWAEFKISSSTNATLYGFLQLANGAWVSGGEGMSGAECSIPVAVAGDFGYTGYNYGINGVCR